MAAWPSSLPQSPLLQNYSEQEKDAVLRSQMGYGPDKLRNLVTGSITPITMRMLMDEAQTETLDTFYVTTIARVGTVTGLLHPRTGAAITFRFLGPPIKRPVGTKYYVDMQIEVLP